MRGLRLLPLLIIFFHCSAAAKEVPITLVAVGDVNLNRTRVDVREDGVYLWGKVVPFDKQLKRIKGEINGDINFCNLETTVMDRNDIKAADKAYNFKCHPNAVRAIQDVGFNLFSFANNHAKDYGPEGIKETRKWLKKLGRKKTLHFSGAGEDIDEASEPVVFKTNGVKVAFSAVSNSTRATEKRAGVASIYKPEAALKKLKAAKADIRILSMHAGEEKNSKPVRVQRNLARTAIAKYDVDIVIGHHAHVVQGIEYYKGGLIFYGLGNFAMRGAKNMGSVKEFLYERDFGLLARLKMVWDTGKRELRFRKLEVVPVYDMHSGPHRFKKDEAAQRRVESLNRFSTSEFLGKGHGGVAFEFVDGSGVYRFPKGKAEPKADEKKVEKKKSKKKKSKKKKSKKKSKKKKKRKKSRKK